MKRITIIVVLLMSATTIYGQEISLDIGVKTGMPLTTFIDPLSVTSGLASAQGSAKRARIAASPTLALIVDRVRIELDAIFKPVRFETVETEACCTAVKSVRGTSLEIPLFVSYRFNQRNQRWHPFLGGGMVLYDRTWGRVDVHNTFHDRGDLETRVVTSLHNNSARNLTPPFIAGGGLEFAANRFSIRPELRYTTWRRNQVDLFLGIEWRTFQKRKSGS
jgi:hypothetical protein